MKLTSKWLLWFVLVTVYAAMIGGLFYYNLFKFVFDKKLQNEMVEMVRYRASELVQALAARPKGGASFPEADIMKDMLRNDERIKSLIYLNYDGSVRWHENTQFLNMSYTDYNTSVGFNTNAAAQAIRDRMPRVIMFDNGNSYNMAIPLLAKDSVVAGVVDMTVSRESAKKLIHSSMVRYIFGAVVMIFLIGGVLYLFLLLKVIRPLQLLKDSIDAVSFNNPQLMFPKRSDEIGDVGQAVSMLLEKVRDDQQQLAQKEIVAGNEEQQWWAGLLEIMAPRGARAMVLDEDNNILFANFELSRAGKVHLLDIFDSRQQNIIQVVGEALEAPGKILKSTAVDKGVTYEVRAVQLPSDAGKNRVILVLEPKK